jgi:hypothetical protein
MVVLLAVQNLATQNKVYSGDICTTTETLCMQFSINKLLCAVH